MSIKKDKGLLDDLAYTRQFFDRNNDKNESFFDATYASEKKRKYKRSVADKLRTASGCKQAVIKVTSYAKTHAKIANHLSYISRNYQLNLEDQDGNNIATAKEAKSLLDQWEVMYFDNKENSRNTVHITFSSPKGSDRNSFNEAIRECLKKEFSGRNDYVFAQHDDTDHPHAHAVIVMRSIHGKKLDPRKQYLKYLREFFAEKCREHGINVEASQRCERGLTGKSRNSSMVQMHRNRGVIPSSDHSLLNTLKSNNFNVKQSNKERNQQIRKDYAHTAKSLIEGSQSETDPKEIKRKQLAAKLLLDFAKNMPNEATLLEQLNQKVNRHVHIDISQDGNDKEKNLIKKKIDLEFEI